MTTDSTCCASFGCNWCRRKRCQSKFAPYLDVVHCTQRKSKNALCANREFLDVLSKVCKHLPANKEHKCATLINCYGQSIVNIVKKRENIYKIFSKIFNKINSMIIQQYVWKIRELKDRRKKLYKALHRGPCLLVLY